MKTKFTLFAWPVLALISIALLQSCSTSSDVISDRGIQKRKYRSGFYVSNRSATPVAEVRKAEPTLIQSNERSTVDRIDLAPTPTAIASQTAFDSPSTEQAVTSQSQPGERSKNTAEWHNYATSILSNVNIVVAHPAVQAENLNSLNTILTTEQSSKDEVELLIMIILCFLLPPLAVFLLHGISSQFWISVLLTILFWVPGIIYALYLTLTAY